MICLLQLKSGVKAFGARQIFSDASFAINEGEKVGVIGPNGAGKSTLFRILVGQDSLDSGDITRANGLRIGYLAQEDKFSGNETVEEVLSAQNMTPIWELKSLAPGFGLKLSDFAKPVMSLSGGYRMRVKLLQLLAAKPDLMLLDEPTNYLDLETLIVLENFLQGVSSGFMLISHDREFLRRTTDHILEIEGGVMTKYAGNIDDYFEQKALLREQLLKSAASAEAKRKEILDFAARFGAKATKARQVQSRLKQLDKMETIEVRSLPTQAKIRLPEPARTGKLVLKTENADLGYGEKTILRGLRLELAKGDHLGVVGVNGAGKSTLLKSLAGEIATLKGEITRGMNVDIAYFAQHVAERLSPQDNVYEAMMGGAHPDTKRQEVLDLAGSLLFTGDDIQKKVAVLSGGEKSRVALGRILLARATCLLMDEPTNHLDFDTVEALTQALSMYSGTVVIVSHDRGFVSRTATKILEVRDGRAEFYPGTYDEYVWSVQKGVLANRNQSSESLSETSGAGSVSGFAKSAQTDVIPVERKFNFKETKKALEKEQRTLEKELQGLDVKSRELNEKILAANDRLSSSTGPEASKIAKEIADHQSQIDVGDERYLQCLERLESIQQELEDLANS